MKTKLDLHGIKHIDVELIVEDFILTNKIPFSIVTGNSNTMKDKTLKLLKQHNFKWMILSHNLGEIIITG